MDGTLSEFLNLLDLRGLTWCYIDIKSSSRCGGFRIGRNEDVMFYAVLRGSVEIDVASGSAIQLRSGNVAMVLSGEGHRVLAVKNGRAVTLDYLEDDHEVDVPPVITAGQHGPIVARVLCGKLKVSWPKGLRRVSMPPTVTFGTDKSSFSNLSTVRAETLQLAGTGPGAAALLTQLAAVMLTSSLRSHPRCQLLFRSSAWNDPVAHALHLIETDPSTEWSIEQLARRVGMGRSSFAAKFSEQVGCTPMNLITSLRMQHAATLLQETDLKLFEISERVGYRSEAAFSRRFTRHYGIPPSKVRSDSDNKEKLLPLSPLDQVISPPK